MKKNFKTEDDGIRKMVRRILVGSMSDEGGRRIKEAVEMSRNSVYESNEEFHTEEMVSEELEFEEIADTQGEVFSPRFGINESSKFLAVRYRNGEVEDNEYFDKKEDAYKWAGITPGSGNGTSVD